MKNLLRTLPLLLLCVAGAPLPTLPDWTVDYSDYELGRWVAGIGDVNGDGYDDVAVTSSEAGVFVHLGSPSGLELEWSSFFAWNSAYGYVASGAGDVDGDGYDDMIVGAPNYSHGQTNEGIVFLFRGSADGLSSIPDAVLEGNQAYAKFGASVAGAGDLDNDGLDDFIVGAPNANAGPYVNVGAVYAFRGSRTELPRTAAWTVGGDQEQAQFGASASSAGDVNGDGFDDIIVGAPNYRNDSARGRDIVPIRLDGRASIHLGGAAGLVASPAWADSPEPSGRFGSTVSGAGDIDADGFDDIVIGAAGTYSSVDEPTGVVHVRFGGPGGIDPERAWSVRDLASVLGWSVSAAGDVNADGHADFIAGAIGDGRVFLWLGGPGGPGETPDWSAQGTQTTWEEYGTCVAAAGDVNGDGADDIIVGSPAEAAGRAYAYYGRRPAAPSGLFQRDGATELPPGGTTLRPGVLLGATVSDLEGSPLRLQAEFKPVGAAFDGTGLLAGPEVASGTVATIAISGLPAATAHHWRVRSLKGGEEASSWVEFGGNGDAVDIATRANAAPTAASADQLAAGRPVPVGGEVLERSLILRACLDDADPAEELRFDIEIRRAGGDFTGIPTRSVSGVGAGSSGDIEAALPEDAYEWRFRAVDIFNAEGEWEEFGGNPSGVADFVVVASGSLGPGSCLHSTGTTSGNGLLLGLIAIIFLRRIGPPSA